jgi:glycosyltransferase involved in cell wall biosynthesis
MKVLWFSNTPANAVEYFHSEIKDSGGWLKALDQSLQNDIELHVAFYHMHDGEFKFKETFYHTIKTNQSNFKKIYNRLTNYVADKQDLSKYLDIIDLVKPDIIHIHGTENPFACIIPHINIPVVVSIQGNITVCLHKFLSGFDKSFLNISNRNFSNLQNFLFPKIFSLQYKKYKKMQKREEQNLSWTKNIIGRTDWDERITRILSPYSNYYHGDEILRDSFYQYQWTPKFDKIIHIYTINSDLIYKGFETLCQALYELNKIGIECQWKVAGINSYDLIVKITKKKLKHKYPEDNIVLLGNLSEKNLIKGLLDADIYVMTSHIENSPNNLCEAMILGMPCISTFAGGTGSLINDGKDGILIQSGDPWAMAGAILELFNNKEKAVQMGKNAREAALKRHDKNRIVSNLIKVYQEIAG